MGCGCANRMRKYVLPTMRYELEDGMWTNEETGDVIPDAEVEEHYTRLTARIMGDAVKNFFSITGAPA